MADANKDLSKGKPMKECGGMKTRRDNYEANDKEVLTIIINHRKSLKCSV